MARRTTKIVFTIAIIIALVGLSSMMIRDNIVSSANNASLMAVLMDLGEPMPRHYITDPDEKWVEKGFQLIHEGKAKEPDGNMGPRISKHFQCVNCHNTVKESEELTELDPEKRLDYAMKHNTPYLQGSTLFGVVNRTSWYNGDYVKKYGDLVIDARDTLENAIQLCAKECSQGRPLKDWEMKAILHYLSKLEITIEDLNLTEEQQNILDNKEIEAGEKIAMLKKEYLQASPATFLEPRPREQRLLGKQGNATRGKGIYVLSCMQCHDPAKEITNLKLDTTSLSLNLLKKHINKPGNDKNIYYITRRGTYPIPGYKPYMPLYIEEKLSEKQLEDLAAYIMQYK